MCSYMMLCAALACSYALSGRTSADTCHSPHPGTPTFNNTFFCDPRSVTGCYYHDKARTGTYATAAAACEAVGGGLVRYRSWVEQTMVEVSAGGGGEWGWWQAAGPVGLQCKVWCRVP